MLHIIQQTYRFVALCLLVGAESLHSPPPSSSVLITLPLNASKCVLGDQVPVVLEVSFSGLILEYNRELFLKSAQFKPTCGALFGDPQQITRICIKQQPMKTWMRCMISLITLHVSHPGTQNSCQSEILIFEILILVINILIFGYQRSPKL